MCQQGHLTVGELGRIYALPSWKIRRLVDSLGIEIPRAGLYRLVPRELITTIETELRRRGWLPPPAVPENPDAHDVIQASQAAQPRREVIVP